MKKGFKALFIVLAAAIVSVITGCASAATLMSRGDNVGAIEKLASTLTKKPEDQESADLFVSLYPSEVENRIQYTERNVPDIINDWVRSQGQSSLTSALRARKQAIGSNTFLADDGEIRSLINEMEITHKNLKDLEKIQRAVVKMPNEIGDVEVYFVEKYSDNFSGMAQIADRSMAEFYYELANAAAPGVNRSQKKAVFDLYDKVNLYSTGYANISAKRAEAAYALAEDYLSGSTIDEKKEAISWFNRANNIVTNYNDTNTRIREANYQIGLLYILKWADADLNNANTIISNEYQIRSDMNNAIKYLEESRGYKDASTHIANCRKVLAALDALHADPTSRAADSGTTNTGTTNAGTTNSGTTTTPGTSTNTGTTTTPAATSKKSVLVPDAPKFSLGSNNKINAAVSVVTQGDVGLTQSSVKLVSNTAGATVKSITVLKSIDSSFTKYKSRDLSAKTGSYTINFELSQAGSFTFNIVDAKGVKVDLATADGRSGTISPTYTLSTTEYNKLIPAKEPTPSTPSTPSTPTVTAPVVLVDSNAKYSVVNKKVNATVNIAVEGDLTVTARNIEFDLNTVGATVKSVAPLKTLDTSLTKIQTPIKTKATATKVTGYTITFELSKAGQFIFRVLDAKGGKVQHNATNGKKDTCSPSYTLTQAEYDKLIPPVQTTPSTPATQTVKPVLQYYKKSSSHYPTYEPVVRFPFELKDVTYTLTKNNIKVVTNNCGATYSLEKETKAAPAKGVTSRYNIVLSNIQKSGDFVYSVLDNAGKVITSNTNQTTDTFSVDLNQVFAPSVMYNDSIFFSKTGEANTNFNVYGLSTDRQAKHIKIVTNTTGATVKSVTRSDNGNLSYMRVYDIVFTGIKTDGVISFYVLDDAGKNLAIVDSVNGDEISKPKRNPTANDIVKYNVKVQNIKSAHQVVYGSAAAYPKTIGQVTIPFTLKPSGTAPAFTASNVVVLTNGTGGTVSAVQSTGSNNYNIVLANVTKSGTFQYRLKDASGYTITPEGFKNSAGATHSTAASPAYSIDFSKVAAEPVKVSAITYKEGSYSTSAAEYIIPFSLEDYSSPVSINEVNVTKNTTGGTVTVTGTASNAQLIIRNITKTGVFSFTYKDRNTGKVMANTNAKTTPEYSIDVNKVWTKPVLQYYKKSDSHYPTYEPVVRFPFELKDVTYTLTKNNIKVVTNNCGATYSLEKETKAAPAKGVTSRYNIVLSNIQKSGDFTYSVLDNAGKVITSNTNQTTDTFTVDLSKVFTASVMYNNMIFFTDAKEARTNFNIYGLNSDIQVKNIKIATNSTGATVSSVTRTDNGKSPNMRTYNIVFTGIKTDGAIGFYVLDAAGNTLAVVHSVNGDEISLPTRNPTLSDIQKYNIRVADVRSAHQVVYGSSPAYPQTKGQVTIPFTLKPSGTAPAFTASNVVVVTNGTGGTVSSVQSLGNNNYNIVLANVTRTGAFQYRLKDANGYTITPEGFKNSGGATHTTAASPSYSIDFSKVSDGLSTLKVTYDSAVTYPSDIGTAKLTFTVTDGFTTTSSIKSAAKDLTAKTPAPVGGPVAGIPGTTIQLPTSLKMSNVDIRVNGTNATASLKHLGSGKYELLLTGVTRTGTFQFQLKDSDGNLIGYTNSSTVLSPAYTIDSSRVAQAKIRTADKVVYGSENNAVVEKVSLTSEGGLVLKQENFTLVTNTCGAKILRLDRAGSSNNYTLVLSATRAGKFSFSVKVGSITPFVYTQKEAAKKAVNANVSMEYEVSVANGGTLQQKLELLEQIDSSKPAKTLDLNSMIQRGTGVNGALQLRDDSGNVYTLKDNPVSKDLQNARDKIEADGYLKADALKDKVIR